MKDRRETRLITRIVDAWAISVMTIGSVLLLCVLLYIILKKL